METEELLAEVDENDKVIAIHPKSKLKELAFRHRLALIAPKAENAKILLAKRAKTKFPFPGVWCFAIGGKVKASESYEVAAHRELLEEAGISTNLELAVISKVDLSQEKAIAHIFVTKKEVIPQDLQLDSNEIEYVKAFTLEEISTMITKNENEFAPTFRRHFQNFKESLSLKI